MPAYHAASGSTAEDLFIDLFSDTFGAEKAGYAMNTATHLDFLIYNRITKKPVLAIEVDGFHFHKQGTAQYDRDRLKDHILKLYNIPMLRFPTNGSGEIEKIAQALDAYAQCK